MKLMNLALIAVLFLMNSALFSQTNISGNQSGTLTLAGSPYQAIGHLMIQPNNTLVIEPGVVVEFQGHFKLNIQGSLRAKGTVTDTIVFRMKPALASTGWWGLRFEMTPASQDSSIIEYCNISGGMSNGTGDDTKGGGIFIKFFNKVRVSHNMIQGNCASYGAGIALHWTNARINHNNICNNTNIGGFSQIGGMGIFCDSLTSSLISYNSIYTNTLTFGGWGGGIACFNSSPTIKNNNIHHNTANVAGGGISCRDHANPVIEGNNINYNFSYSGGGIYMTDFCAPSIIQNTINNNNVVATVGSQAYGGGILSDCIGCAPLIEKNLIAYNNADNRGGGMELFNYPVSTVRENTIHANRSNVGAGVSLITAETHFYNNVITNNFGGSGSGVNIESALANSYMSGDIVANNTSVANGGGLYISNSSLTITNCDIVNNYANTMPSYTTYLYGGAGIYCTGASNPKFTNCIIHGNQANSNNGHNIYLDDNASDPPINYSILGGGLNGMYTNGSVYSGAFTNNLTSGPVFMMPSAGTGTAFNAWTADWRLQTSSPCINSGKPDSSGLFLPPVDQDGNLRIKGIIDRGAYETSSCGNFQVNTGVNHIGITASAIGVGTSYAWLNCNQQFAGIPGANGPSYTPANTISYCLSITQFGCTDTSECFIATVGLLENGKNSNISIYPNPCSEKLFFAGIKENVTAEFYSISGSLVKKVDLKNTEQSIDISHLPAGLYFVKLNETTFKLIKP